MDNDIYRGGEALKMQERRALFLGLSSLNLNIFEGTKAMVQKSYA